VAQVVGIGGIFFKSPDPAKLYAWYRQYLGMPDGDEGAAFTPDTLPPGAFSIFGAFRENTHYFEPSYNAFMFNLIVDDVDEALAQVREGGAEVVGDVVQYEHGKFGWFVDPDGNKVELWQPGA
jgi:predicted enzyme related to lactoylglutathione lyase